jgi:hypothetical protein
MRIKTILALVLIAVIPHAFAANINVPGDYVTIQDAVDAANNGDTILVHDGIYEGAFVDKAVHIKGVGQAVINVGVYTDTLFAIGMRGFVVTADGASFSHLTIRNVGIGIEGAKTEANPTVDGVAISHVSVTNPTPVELLPGIGSGLSSFGILNWWEGEGWTVTHSKFKFIDGLSGYGIYIRKGTDSLIAFNDIEHHEDAPANVHYFGVILLDAKYNRVLHNKILIEAEKRGCVGLAGPGAMYNTVGFNDFRGSTVDGVAAVWGGSADDNNIAANLGANRSTISDADASDFNPIMEP